MKILNLLITATISIILLSCSHQPSQYYISPDGSDQNKGTIDAPFQTISKAKQTIRQLPKQKRNADITVYLKGGTYQLSETIVFGLEDAAPDGYNYTYKAWNNEKPILSSGIKIENWTQTTKFPKGFPDKAKGKVFEADFPEDLDKFYLLFDGYKRIDRARKEGFVIQAMESLKSTMDGENIDKNSQYIAARSMNVYHDKDRLQLKKFHFNDTNDILRNWENISEIEVGFAPVPWCMNILPIEKIDFDAHIGYIQIEANSPPGAKLSHTKPWIENAIDYISEGTFVTLDSKKKIYYWPKQNNPSENIVVPLLLEYVRFEGDVHYNDVEDIPVKNITLSGITFMHGDRYEWTVDHKGWGIQHDWDKFDNANSMLRFRGAENCVVENCRFTNSGNSAVRLDLHCQNITVQNNLIDYVGHMGILLCGYGPGTKDVNKNNTITNNLIHHVGQVITHGAGIFVWQSGENIISHNLIHHVPRKGIGLCGVRTPILAKEWCNFDEGSKTIRWEEINADLKSKFPEEHKTLGEYWTRTLPYLHARNNKVEFNEVYRALEYLADGSVLNVSGAGEGNMVRNNYVHHIASHASGALRTDDWQRGTTFENNIIYMTNISGIVHKGFNHIINNKIIDCSVKEFIRFASYPDEEADYNSLIQRNIFYESGDKINYYRESYRASEGISLPHNCKIDNNLFCVAENMKDAENHIKNWNKRGVENNSIAADPLFEGMEEKGFKLKPESPTFKLGFKEIDFDAIGLKDNYPAEFLKHDVPDDGRKANFHRNRKDKESIYDFW